MYSYTYKLKYPSERIYLKWNCLEVSGLTEISYNDLKTIDKGTNCLSKKKISDCYGK